MTKRIEAGLLVVRLVLGVTFFIHGIVKFQGGIENTAGWFASIGIPGFAAYAVAAIEVLGGIALIAGLGTRIVSIVFALLMIGAILKVKLAAGFMGNGQMAGYELDLALMAISILLGVSGSRMLAVDRYLQPAKSSVSEQY